MRLVLAVVFFLPALVSAQELHTFKNGEVADADKINDTHQYILNNASGGCSVEQVNNTAEITCADGTTAVVPGYGTVMVFPEGGNGSLPDVTYNTGDVVVYDANDVPLARVLAAETNRYQVKLSVQDVAEAYRAYIANEADANEVVIRIYGAHYIYLLDENCTGAVWKANSRWDSLSRHSGKLWATPWPLDTNTQENLLFKSRKLMSNGMLTEAGCENGEYVRETYLAVEYTPAPEILNAAYPVRLEQLP